MRMMLALPWTWQTSLKLPLQLSLSCQRSMGSFQTGIICYRPKLNDLLTAVHPVTHSRWCQSFACLYCVVHMFCVYMCTVSVTCACMPCTLELNSVRKSAARIKHCVHAPEINRHFMVAIHTQQHRQITYKTNSLLVILVFNLLYGPALASLCAIKMHNGRVELFQSWPMSNGQHGNAPLNTRTIQLHLPICTHLQYKAAE